MFTIVLIVPLFVKLTEQSHKFYKSSYDVFSGIFNKILIGFVKKLNNITLCYFWVIVVVLVKVHTVASTTFGVYSFVYRSSYVLIIYTMTRLLTMKCKLYLPRRFKKCRNKLSHRVFWFGAYGLYTFFIYIDKLVLRHFVCTNTINIQIFTFFG